MRYDEQEMYDFRMEAEGVTYSEPDIGDKDWESWSDAISESDDFGLARIERLFSFEELVWMASERLNSKELTRFQTLLKRVVE